MDEAGCFWKGLPEVSLNEKGGCCTGGKKSMQRNTWAFFVNAAGGKEDPIVIGKSEKPRCFNNLKDISRPYKCHYVANNKAWMNSDLMLEILLSLDRRLQRQQREILLFMDNAPCHPASFHLRNITVYFLPKNTTSKTQHWIAELSQVGSVNTRKSYCTMCAVKLMVPTVQVIL